MKHPVTECIIFLLLLIGVYLILDRIALYFGFPPTDIDTIIRYVLGFIAGWWLYHVSLRIERNSNAPPKE